MLTHAKRGGTDSANNRIPPLSGGIARRWGTATALVLAVLAWTLPTTPALGDQPRGRQLEYDPKKGNWVEQPPPVPGTADGDLRLASAALAEGDAGEAEDRIDDWLDDYGSYNPLYPDALILRARVEIARRDYYKAHKHLKEFLAEFGATRYVEDAIRYQFVIAEVFLSGTKRKVLGMRILPAKDLGISILDDISANFPDTEAAELAIKTKADHFYDTGQFGLAEDEYRRLLENFPRSRYARYALKRIADSAMASWGGIAFDEAALIEAQARYEQYLAQYPQKAEQEGVGLLLETIRQRRAAKEVHIGDYYRRTDHPDAAAFYYRSAIRNWPDTQAAVEARNRLQEMGLQPEMKHDGIDESGERNKETAEDKAETEAQQQEAGSPQN